MNSLPFLLLFMFIFQGAGLAAQEKEKAPPTLPQALEELGKASAAAQTAFSEWAEAGKDWKVRQAGLRRVAVACGNSEGIAKLDGGKAEAERKTLKFVEGVAKANEALEVETEAVNSCAGANEELKKLIAQKKRDVAQGRLMARKSGLLEMIHEGQSDLRPTIEQYEFFRNTLFGNLSAQHCGNRDPGNLLYAARRGLNNLEAKTEKTLNALVKLEKSAGRLESAFGAAAKKCGQQ